MEAKKNRVLTIKERKAIFPANMFKNTMYIAFNTFGPCSVYCNVTNISYHILRSFVWDVYTLHCTVVRGCF